jgi:hypothetical protein
MVTSWSKLVMGERMKWSNLSYLGPRVIIEGIRWMLQIKNSVFNLCD